MRVFAVVMGLVITGCGTLAPSEADDPPGPPVTEDGGGSATSTAPSEPTPDAAAPSCTLETTVLHAVADTVLIYNASACPGDLSYGEANGLNTKVGGAAIRFDLDDVSAAALLAETIVSAKLEIDTNPVCDGCGPAPGLVAVAGTLKAYPMRVDWDEGHPTGKTGADACRRTASGAGWGTVAVASGTSRIAAKNDYATALAGQAPYGDGATSITIPLDTHVMNTYDTTRGDAGASTRSVAFYLTSDQMLILASREAHAPLLTPRLAITRCAP